MKSTLGALILIPILIYIMEENVILKEICNLAVVYLRIPWHSYSIISVPALNL